MSPERLTLLTLFVLLQSLICLVGLAASLGHVGKRKLLWILAAVVVWIACEAVPAPELTAALAAQFATVWLGFAILRPWLNYPVPGGQPPSLVEPASAARPRFSLRSLLGVMLLSGVIAAPLSKAETPWYQWPIDGALWGVATLVALFWEAGRARARWRYLALALTPLVVGFALGALRSMVDYRTDVLCYTLSGVGAIVIAALVRLGRIAGLLDGMPASPGFKPLMARCAFWAACAAIIAPPAVLFVMIRRLSPPKPIAGAVVDVLPKLPAGLDWTAIPNQDVDTATLADLDAFVSANEADLKCLADYSWARVVRQPKWTDADVNIDEFSTARAMARVQIAVARAADLHSQVDEAIDGYVRIVYLGAGYSRGGLLIHRLVGDAIASDSINGLWSLRGRWDAQQCRRVNEFLDAQERAWEPNDAVLAREELWIRVTNYWQDQLQNLFDHDYREGCATAELYRLTRNDLLRVEIAIRRFGLEHGHDPDSLAELTPDFLAEMPIDRWSRRPLVYRREPTGHTLYSIGVDKRDDGGKPDDDLILGP